jgi:hypothetical protein
MVTITPPTPILDPSPAIRRAVVDYQLAWVAHRATLRDQMSSAGVARTGAILRGVRLPDAGISKMTLEKRNA